MTAPSTVLEAITRQFSEAPDREAVASGTETLTYRELDDASARFAGALIAAGVRRTETVLVHTESSVWAITAILGLLRAGACFAVVDAALPPVRRAAMITASRARWIAIEPGRELDGPSAAALTRSPAMTVNTDGTAPATVDPVSADPAYLCFTSGSTGAPKAVVVGHGALAHSTMARPVCYPDPVRGFVLGSSLSFDSAYAGIFWTLATGGVLLIPATRPGDLLAIARTAADPRASHTLLVPSLYAVALNSAVRERFSGLTAVIVAGEACPPALVRRHFETLPGVALYNEYGPTETTVWATVHRCTVGDGAAAAVPIGAPIPGVRLYVRDAGELWIGGPTVAAGYLDGSDADHARFRTVDGEHLYRTGDLVEVDAGGTLVYRGRVDRQVKLSGVRVELEEIEAVLTGTPGVTGAGVGVHDDDGLTLVAVYSGSAPPAALRAQLRAALPAGAVPAGFVSTPRVPRRPNGKLDRRALDERARDWVSARRVPEGA